jgi:hypothetical protein
MCIYTRQIYKDYTVNVTTISSYSALSKLIYLSNYYADCGEKIPIISGYLEGEIRRAYYGGIVDVVRHIISSGYKYDSNSHYPSAMLNDMPVGNPRVSDLKDLDRIFGFCDVTVTAPSEDVLAVPFLPAYDELGNVHCPRGVFSGSYFSEELKFARKHGYIIDVHSSILFRRGKDLFTKFICSGYKRKAMAKSDGD